MFYTDTQVKAALRLIVSPICMLESSRCLTKKDMCLVRHGSNDSKSYGIKSVDK